MNKQNNEDFSYINVLDMHSTILAMKTDKVCQQLTNNKKLFQVNIFRHIFNCIGLEKNMILPFELFYEDVNHNKILPRKMTEAELKSLKNMQK